MKLNRTLLSAAFAAIALVSTNLAEVRAASITQVDQIGQTATPISALFNFNGFDSSLGTLTSVVLTVEETVNGVVSVINISPNPEMVTSAFVTAPVTATSPAGSTSVTATAGITNQVVPGGGAQTNFANLAGTLSNSTTYTGAFVNPFYSNSTIPVSVTSGAGVVTGTPTGGNLFFGGTVTAAVKVALNRPAARGSASASSSLLASAGAASVVN